MRVSGYQMCVNDNSVNDNYVSICEALKKASSDRSDIMLTPEGALSGYHNRFNNDEVQKALNDIVSLAKSLKIGLALGTCIYEQDGKCYNQIRFYEKDGRFLGFHSKILTCSESLDEPYSGEITFYSVKPLEVFEFQGVKIAGLICNDMWANPCCTPVPDPHLTHLLARMGARVIFHAVNGGKGDQDMTNLFHQFHESNQRLRAIADKLYIVTVDNAYPPDRDNTCTGGVISPEGKYLCKLPIRGEGFFTQEIPI